MIAGQQKGLSERIAGRLSGLICALLVSALALVAAASPLDRMIARRAEIDEGLKNQIIGEQLDGFLAIRMISPESEKLAEVENKDRRELFARIGTQIGRPLEAVAEDFAQKHLDRYKVGIWRQVTNASGSVQWWNGNQPDPRTMKKIVKRVIALENAKFYGQPAGSPSKGNIAYFSVFHVLNQMMVGNEAWYEVTSKNPTGTSIPRGEGWMRESEVIPWQHALVMKFESPLGRPRSLMFKSKNDFQTIASLPAINDRKNQMESLRSPFKQGLPASSMIAGIEPVFSKKDSERRHTTFFPIVNHDDKTAISGQPALLLEIAGKAQNQIKNNVRKDLAVDLVFAVDTTGSMGDYLQAILEEVKGLAAKTSGQSTDIRFGFVGYRDNLPILKEKFKGSSDSLKDIKLMEYSVKHFTPQLQDVSQFVTTLETIKPVSKKTPDDKAEEVFAGVYKAIEDTNWRPDSARVVILIGDAPGHPIKHEQSMVNFDHNTIPALAGQQKVGILAIHIKNSESGKSVDDITKRHFDKLATTQGSGTKHYLPVDASDIGAFRGEIADVLQTASELVKEAAKKLGKPDPSSIPDDPRGMMEDLILSQAVFLLADPNTPSSEAKGWVSDLVVEDPGRHAMTPMVLLSKNELKDLIGRLTALVSTSEDYRKKRKNSQGFDFFTELQQNSQGTVVNPQAVNYKDAFGVPANIDQLPYKSSVMEMEWDDLKNMADQGLDEFVSDLHRKLAYYNDLYLDEASWSRMSQDTDNRDRVAPIPLELLP